MNENSLALQAKTHHNTLMNDEQETTPENNIDEPQDSEAVSNFGTEDFDVEGALAAVASLHELAAPDEIEAVDDDVPDIEEFERIGSDEDELAQESETALDAIEPNTYDSIFPRPPVSVLHRGQLASIIPAILLIGIGGYLAFLMMGTQEALNPATIAPIAIGGFAVILLAQWISSARWAMGSFFIAALILLIGGTAAYLVLPNNLSLAQGWPLLFTAAGTAFVISDLFVPSGRRLWLVGLILAISGLAGTVATSNLLGEGVQQVIGTLWPVAIIIILVLLIAPVLRRQ